MADSIKNISPNIILPEGSSEHLLRLDIPAADILNRSGIMHAGISRVRCGYKASRYNVCKHFAVFVVAGKLQYLDSYDRLCLAEAGQRVLMPISYQQHYWADENLEFCWLHLHSVGVWKKLDTAVINGKESRWWRELYAAMQGYYNEGCSGYTDSSEVAGLYAGLICKYLEREIVGAEVEIQTKDQELELELMLSRVSAELARRWTVAELAELIYVSPAQLHRMVKSVYRASPMQLVRELRLDKARELLCNTEQSLESIAVEIGYENAFSLSKAFKKHFNVTPADLRRCSGLDY